jgi:prepilin-type N-terminal cleavage/methylation domain-containing protein
MTTDFTTRRKRDGQSGMTLMEIVMAIAISVVLLTGIFKGYLIISRRSMFAAYSVAANALAMKQMESIVTSTWIPSYGTTNLFNPQLTATQTNALGMPGSSTNLVYATNYASVRQLSTTPPYALVRVDCVWTYSDMGTFTNTVALIRGPNTW